MYDGMYRKAMCTVSKTSLISRLSAGHEDSLMSLVRFDPFFAKVEQSLIVSQIVGHQTCTSPKIQRVCPQILHKHCIQFLFRRL